MVTTTSTPWRNWSSEKSWPCRAPGQSHRQIQEGEQVGAVARLDGQEVPIEIDAKVELYFDTDDLKKAM
jgi:hypothetical protein